MMHQEDIYLNQLIEKALKNNKDAIPTPPISKTETWKIIDQTLMNEEKKRKKFPKKTGVWVTAVVLMLLVIPLFHTQNASAFSWFTKYFSVIQGKITHLMGSSGQPPASGEQPPLPKQEFSIVKNNMHYERMSLEKAQKQAKFQIKIPNFIPDGYKLKDVTVLVEDDRKSDDIELNYIKGSEGISIKEIFVEHQMGYGMSFDNEDTKIKEVNIKSAKGTLLTFKDESKRLVWDAPLYQFELSGKIPEEEIIKVATSFDF